MSGEVRTQLTQVYLLDTVDTTGSVKEINNVADVGQFGPTANDIDITNLMSTAKEYLVGLPDNGTATLQINFNPRDKTHQMLNGLAGTATRVQFIVGLSDGTSSPTDVAGVLTPGAARTWAKFTASVKSFQGAYKADDAVRATCALRISGGITWTYHA